MSEERAQVNLEFLLIIVGGVVIVTGIALYLKGAANNVAQSADAAAKQNP